MMRTALAATALAMLTVACGGASGDDGVASLSGEATGTTMLAVEQVDREEAILAFTDCLREQGLDVADPELDGNGNLRPGLRPQGGADVDPEEARAARDACAEHLDGLTLGFEQVDRSDIEDVLVEYAACMRDNGVDIADPEFSAGGPGGGGGPGAGNGPLGDIDPEDPAFQAADEVCRDVFTDAGLDGGPGPGFGRGGGPGS